MHIYLKEIKKNKKKGKELAGTGEQMLTTLVVDSKVLRVNLYNLLEYIKTNK